MEIWSKLRNTAYLLGGHGIEFSKDTWEREYGRGDWNYLHGLDQWPRYVILAGYLTYLRPGAEILDVGCGDGVLQRLLARDGYRRYLGVDLSERAVQVASQGADERTCFQQCDAATWQPPGRFDVIIFNEALYYFYHPADVLKAYEPALFDDGFFVVSMYLRAGNTRRIWNRIVRNYACLHQTVVSSGRRNRWMIRVLGRPGQTLESIQKRAPTQPPSIVAGDP